MVNEILSSVNWVDVLVIGIMVRTICVGFKSSFVVEFFKFLGILLGVFIILHYFSCVSKLFVKYLHFSKNFAEGVAFVFLWLAVILIFTLIRDGFLAVFKITTSQDLDRWGGSLLAMLRGLLISSLTVLLIQTSQAKFLTYQVRHSFSGGFLENVAPSIYQFFYKKVCKPIFNNEPFNQKAFSLKSSPEPEESDSPQPKNQDSTQRFGFFDRP